MRSSSPAACLQKGHISAGFCVGRLLRRTVASLFSRFKFSVSNESSFIFASLASIWLLRSATCSRRIAAEPCSLIHFSMLSSGSILFSGHYELGHPSLGFFFSLVNNKNCLFAVYFTIPLKVEQERGIFRLLPSLAVLAARLLPACPGSNYRLRASRYSGKSLSPAGPCLLCLRAAHERPFHAALFALLIMAKNTPDLKSFRGRCGLPAFWRKSRIFPMAL